MNALATAAPASLSIPERVSGRSLFPAIHSPEDWAELPIGRGPSRKELHRGYGLGRKAHGLDLRANPNTLVLGSCGTGKSVLLRQIAAAAVTRGHDVHVIDPLKRGLNFRSLRPWLAGAATEYPAAAATLESLVGETNRRLGLLETHRVDHWTGLPTDIRSAKGVWPITVIVDEYASLVRTEPVPRSTNGLDPELLREIQERNETVARIMASIGTLLRRARYAGIHVVVGTQRVEYPAFQGGLEHFDSVVYMLRENNNPTGLAMSFHGKALSEDIDAAINGIGDALSLKGAAVMADSCGSINTFRAAYAAPDQLADGLRELLGDPSAEGV